MARRILVQLHNITPPQDFGIRAIEPKPDPADRTPIQPTIQLHEESGGCRTDQLLWELSASGFRLIDVHMKCRDPNGRRIPVLNFTYADEGRGYLLVLPPYEDWCSSHISKYPGLKETSPEEQAERLPQLYQRWCQNLPPRFQAWMESLFKRSWAAGRAFVYPELICVNLLGSFRIRGDDLPLSISEYLGAAV